LLFLWCLAANLANQIALRLVWCGERATERIRSSSLGFLIAVLILFF